jgi:hypothetical protein
MYNLVAFIGITHCFSMTSLDVVTLHTVLNILQNPAHVAESSFLNDWHLPLVIKGNKSTLINRIPSLSISMEI